MAGSYLDVPSRRMAWDDDGTVDLRASFDTGSTGGLAVGTLPYAAYVEGGYTNFNKESNAEKMHMDYRHAYWFTYLFPEKRELDGIYVCYATNGPTGWSTYSTDTTDGISGTWTSLSYDGRIGGDSVYPTVSRYREQIHSLALSNVRGTMINGMSGNGHWHNTHFYGTITPGETPDRLIFLDTLNADAVFTKVLDYGDVPRGQTQTRTFKVKNNSATKTATTVQVTAEDLDELSGGWYSFSDDDVSYQATYPVGNLNPGATQQLYIKQVVPDAQTPGPYAARIKANQASWS